MTSETFRRKIEDLRRQYRQRLPSEIETTRQLYAEFLASNDGLKELRELHVVVHRIAGSGATFGFPAISESARALEHLLGELLETKKIGADNHAEIADLLASLGNSIRSAAEDYESA